MAKFRENDLTNILKNFKNKTKIQLKFECGLEGKMILEDATVIYDRDFGFINIKGKEAEFRINTTLVHAYEKNDNEISIYLESIILKIATVQ